MRFRRLEPHKRFIKNDTHFSGRLLCGERCSKTSIMVLIFGDLWVAIALYSCALVNIIKVALALSLMERYTKQIYMHSILATWKTSWEESHY